MSISLRSKSQEGCKESGFSLIETVVVVAIISITLAMALVGIVPAINSSRSNSGMELVLGELRRAHERAIDERRIYRVTFVAPQTIQVDVGLVVAIGSTITGSSPAFVAAQPPMLLPATVQFLVIPGIPATAATAPDGLGSGAKAIDLDVANGGGTQIYFQPDGRALDALNRLNDGVVYVAEPGNLYSSRAVSVFGSTGRVKSWFLTNVGGAAGWVQ
jgi:prepilin-type N-terminal cleavage/methylation domain-containing protein